MMPKPSKERTKSNPWPQWPRTEKTDYGQEEAIAVFGKDPRMYQTTVKEFQKDKTEMSKKQFWSAWSLKKIKRQAECRWFPFRAVKKVVDANLVLIAAGLRAARNM